MFQGLIPGGGGSNKTTTATVFDTTVFEDYNYDMGKVGLNIQEKIIYGPRLIQRFRHKQGWQHP